MPRIQIVADTAHNLPDKVLHAIPMIQVPFGVVVGDNRFRDNCITLAGLAYLLERKKGEYPLTSAPVPGDFCQAYVASQGSGGILVVTIGAKFSASFKNAGLAENIFREETGSDIPIEIVDSRSGTMSQGFLLMEADRLIKGERSLGDIANHLRDLAMKDNLVVELRETTYLHHSGRAGTFQYLLSTALGIKPILAVRDGQLVLLTRKRGSESQAVQRVAEEVLKRSDGAINQLAIIGGLDTKESEKLLEEKILGGLSQPPSLVLHAKMCPAIMVHVGPHGVGAAWL